MDWSVHMGRILSTLGEDVVFTRGTGTPVTVRGYFGNPYQAGAVGPVGVSGTNPVFSALSSAFGATPVKGDTILRSAVTYKVHAVQPDDPGGYTVLELRRS